MNATLADTRNGASPNGRMPAAVSRLNGHLRRPAGPVVSEESSERGSRSGSAGPENRSAGRRLARTRLRAALVDSDEYAHVALTTALEREPCEWLIETHLDGREALARILAVPPRVVVMAVDLPRVSGIECARRMRAIVPELPIVMFSSRSDSESVWRSLWAGALGYVTKPAEAAELRLAIVNALERRPTLSSLAQRAVVEGFQRAGNQPPGRSLSPREHQIMLCLFRNDPDKEIAGQLRIATGTVHVHLHNLYQKLGAHNRHEAVRNFLSFS